VWSDAETRAGGDDGAAVQHARAIPGGKQRRQAAALHGEFLRDWELE